MIYLANRARLLNDPRVNVSYVQELRRELPLALFAGKCVARRGERGA